MASPVDSFSRGFGHHTLQVDVPGWVEMDTPSPSYAQARPFSYFMESIDDVLRMDDITSAALYRHIVEQRRQGQDDNADKLMKKALQMHVSKKIPAGEQPVGSSKDEMSSPLKKAFCEEIIQYLSRGITHLNAQILKCINVNDVTKASTLHQSFDREYSDYSKWYGDLCSSSLALPKEGGDAVTSELTRVFTPVRKQLDSLKQTINDAEKEKIIVQLRRRLTDPSLDSRVKKSANKAIDAVMKTPVTTMVDAEKQSVLWSILVAIQPNLKKPSTHSLDSLSLVELSQRYKTKSSRLLQTLGGFLLAIAAAIIVASVMVLQILVPPVLAVVVGAIMGSSCATTGARFFVAAKGGKDTELSTSLTELHARTAVI